MNRPACFDCNHDDVKQLTTAHVHTFLYIGNDLNICIPSKNSELFLKLNEYLLMILNEQYITQYFSNHLEIGWRTSWFLCRMARSMRWVGIMSHRGWWKKSKQNFSLKPSMEIIESCSFSLVKKQIQIAKC